jgi:hypothetical protein
MKPKPPMKKPLRKDDQDIKAKQQAYEEAKQQYIDADRPIQNPDRSARVGADTAFGHSGTGSENSEAAHEYLQAMFRARTNVREATGNPSWPNEPKKEQATSRRKQSELTPTRPARRELSEDDVNALRSKYQVRERMSAPDDARIPLPKDVTSSPKMAAAIAEDMAERVTRENMGISSGGRPKKVDKSETLSNPKAQFPKTGNEVSGDPEDTPVAPAPSKRVGEHLKKMHGIMTSLKKAKEDMHLIQGEGKKPSDFKQKPVTGTDVFKVYKDPEQINDLIAEHGVDNLGLQGHFERAASELTHENLEAHGHQYQDDHSEGAGYYDSDGQAVDPDDYFPEEHEIMDHMINTHLSDEGWHPSTFDSVNKSGPDDPRYQQRPQTMRNNYNNRYRDVKGVHTGRPNQGESNAGYHRKQAMIQRELASRPSEGKQGSKERLESDKTKLIHHVGALQSEKRVIAEHIRNLAEARKIKPNLPKSMGKAILADRHPVFEKFRKNPDAAKQHIEKHGISELGLDEEYESAAADLTHEKLFDAGVQFTENHPNGPGYYNELGEKVRVREHLPPHDEIVDHMISRNT